MYSEKVMDHFMHPRNVGEIPAKNLGGLPPIKMHCSNLAADALHEAIKDYQKKK